LFPLITFAGDADAEYEAAVTLVKNQKYSAALILIESALKKNPDHPQAYYVQGFALEKEDRESEAVISYLMAVKIVLKKKRRRDQIPENESKAAVKSFEALDRLAPGRTAILRKARDLEKEARDMDHNKVVIDAVQAMRQIAFENAAKPPPQNRPLFEDTPKKPRRPRKVSDDAESFRGNYYVLFSDAPGGVNQWLWAKERCEKLGGHLATIGSNNEAIFLAKLLKQAGVNHAFVGGKTPGVKKWSWITGEPVTFSKWTPQHRTHLGAEANAGCFEAWGNSEYAISRCFPDRGLNYYICEWE